MTNFEKYKSKVLELGNSFAIDKSSGEVDSCIFVKCHNCRFYRNETSCRTITLRWLYEEYEEPTVDWSKVPIDTKVLVSDDGVTWQKRHFAGAKLGGKPTVYLNGQTSWSAGDTTGWVKYKYTKLAEED